MNRYALCISTELNKYAYLTIGNVYKIINIEDNDFGIINDCMDKFYYSEKFFILLPNNSYTKLLYD